MEPETTEKQTSGPKEDLEEIDFYEFMKIEKTASSTEIKKAYYKLARVYHPDKNPDNPEAEARFKYLSEAYEILMDPEKRETYDKYGRAAFKQEGHPSQDIGILFKMLFGGGEFDDCFGELSFSLMMDPEFLMKPDEEKGEILEKKHLAQMETLVAALLAKISLFKVGRHEKNQEFFEALAADVERKREAPGAETLLWVLGYVYCVEAKKFWGRVLGIEGFFARVRSTFHTLKGAVSATVTMAKLEVLEQQMMEEFEANPENLTEEVRAAYEAHMADQTQNLVWKLGQLEIEQTVAMVTEKVLGDPELDGAERKRRCAAVRAIGKAFKAAGKKNQNLMQEVEGQEEELEKRFNEEKYGKKDGEKKKSKSKSKSKSSSSSSSKVERQPAKPEEDKKDAPKNPLEIKVEEKKHSKSSSSSSNNAKPQPTVATEEKKDKSKSKSSSSSSSSQQGSAYDID